MDLDIIKDLSDKARVYMDEAEMQEVADSFGQILPYVGQIENAVDSSEDFLIRNDSVINVFREDIVKNFAGEYRESIIEQMPDSQDGFLKVKQIL